MIPSVSLRSVGDDDVPALISLWQACDLTRPWNDPAADIAKARKSGEAEIIVAISEAGRLVGSVMVGHEGHRAWMYYVAVDPALQGRGLGRHLVQAAEAWAAGRGMEKMHLLIRPENGRVRAFYEAAGYGEQKRVLMARWLDGRPLD